MDVLSKHQIAGVPFLPGNRPVVYQMSCTSEENIIVSIIIICCHRRERIVQ